MPSTLATLRQIPQRSPAQFLAMQPGCWLQYFDDTPARDAAKALAARTFDPDVTRRKQEERCAVCFSLQAFGQTRTKEGLLCFRNLGVDIDLIPAPERRTLSAAGIDARKEAYLESRLLPFPLKPHWLIETRHGFHAIFRVKPLRELDAIREAEHINRRLVRALRGDENAALLTQVLRVPGTFQFKVPEHPFLCRLLMDNAVAVGPYVLDQVRIILDARNVFHGTDAEADHRQATTAPGKIARQPDWLTGLGGVPEGQRNATAASVVGRILCRLPEYLWETAGWGGLKEWNTRNAAPLTERELRSVFESIARREYAKRQWVRWAEQAGHGDGPGFGTTPASVPPAGG